MDEDAVLGALEDLAQAVGVEVRHEPLDCEEVFSSGGLCRLGGRSFLIINSRAKTREKIETVVRALRRFDLSRIYVRPLIRDLLETGREEERGDGYLAK